METASWILLIIVSAVLAIFLTVLIVAIVHTVGILKQVKRITQRAEDVADSVEATANAIGRNASRLSVLRLVSNIVEHATKGGKKRRW